MKRRLAFLLALSLTFASLPVTGAGAAETAAATETEVVTEIAQEEASDEGVSVETEAVEATEEDKNETAAEAAAGEQKQEETVSEENAAAAETTDAEIAAEVEPEVITEGKDAKQEASVKTGWVNEGSSRYYYNAEGKAVTRWQKIDGDWYYFNASGVMQTGWQKINGKWYYLNDDGSMQIGWKDLNHRYYFNGGGAMVTGWQKIDGSWYLFGPGGAMLTGWQKNNNKWYYLNDDGSMQIGWKDLNHRYYFNGGGAMVTGWQKIDGSWYSFGPGGAMLTDWQKINGKWYYLSTDEEQLGQMVIGWKEINNRKYYFDPSGAMATGWRLVDDYWYYMGPGGAMQTGWVYDNNESSWFYLNEDGKMAYGWISYNGNMYYLDPTRGGRMVTSPKKCEKIGGGGYEYYFFNTDGTLGTGEGWKKNGPYWYYTHEDGSLYRNTTITENGRSYRLDEYGRWGDAMDAKAQGYSSNTNYLILVDKTTFKVRVYKGSRNNWTRIKDWDCTHGGSDTPNGVFTIDDHVTKRDATYGWADFDYSSAAYACHISAGNYFHSILYDKGTRGNPYNQSGHILDPDLRTTYSHGCIRLLLDNAKWVWDNIPFGTKVVVYNS